LLLLGLWALGAGLLQVAEGQTAPNQPPAARAPLQQKQISKKAAAHPQPGTHPTAQKTSSTNSAKKGKSHSSQRRGKPTEPVVRKQVRPTSARYAEIQKALGKGGYFQGPADGVWGQSSVSALTKFQKEQGLDPTGKIDALSLIKLGLGPKYDSPTTASVSQPADPPQ